MFAEVVPQIAALVEHSFAAGVLAPEEQLDSALVVTAYLVNLMPFFRNTFKVLNIGTRYYIWNKHLSLLNLVFFFKYFFRRLNFDVLRTNSGPLLAHRLGPEISGIFWLKFRHKIFQAIQEGFGLINHFLFSAFLDFQLLLGNHGSRLSMNLFLR